MSLPVYNGDILELFSRPCNACQCPRLELLHPIVDCVECGHYEHQHKTLQDLLPGILTKMVLLGKTNEQILHYLQLFKMEIYSMRTLKRRLQSFGIYRNVNLEPACIINLVQIAQDKAKKRAGYRRLHRVIRQEFDVPIKRDDVMMAAKVLDPDGPKERLKRNCQRRVFHSLGPNETWSIDGHDKLATFGIYVHGCIDSYSRKVLWCSTYTSNKNPVFVAKWFMDTVKHLQVVPRRARFDPGTENTLTVELQMFLRRNGTDVYAEEKSIILDKSKFNQKIECFWSGLFNKVTSVYHEIFTGMVQMGLIEHPEHREAFIYVFLPIVKEDINSYISWWNNHRIRKQKAVTLPTGCSPDDVYYMPELYGGTNCGYSYDLEDMAVAADYHEIPGELCDVVSNDFRRAADRFLLENGLSLTRESADMIFAALCNRI